MSEEENLPTPEEMRARYANLMKDEASEEASAEDAAAHIPQDTEAERAAAEEPAAEEPLVEDEVPTADPRPPTPDEVDEEPDPGAELALHLLDVNVRLWAELGRSQLPLAQAVALGTGAIVDLDKEPDDKLDVFVNGLPFATATLLLVDGEWAIRLEEIVAKSSFVEQASSSGSGA